MLTPFSQIIAQDQAKEMLRRALGGNRLAHAYLFRGPAGVGKKTAARALAAALNCVTVQQQHLDPLEACGQCPSCRKFSSGNHPDFQAIMPEGAGIKIGQVREIKKSLQFPPMEAGRRVVLLAEVHTMRREAANSLLKVLEEPPADTIFILTGDEAGGILPTILSRCQIVPFYPLGLETLARALLAAETSGRRVPQKPDDAGSSAAADASEAGRRSAENERQPVFAAPHQNRRQDAPLPEELLTLAAVAEGSLGLARQLLAKDLLGQRRQIITLLLSLRPEDPAAVPLVLHQAEKCAQLKDELDDFLDLLASCYHDLAVLTTLARQQPPSGTSTYNPSTPAADEPAKRLPADQKRPPVINQDLLDLLLPAAAGRNAAPQEQARTAFRRAKGQLKRNCNRTLVCEVLFFALL